MLVKEMRGVTEMVMVYETLTFWQLPGDECYEC